MAQYGLVHSILMRLVGSCHLLEGIIRTTLIGQFMVLLTGMVHTQGGKARGRGKIYMQGAKYKQKGKYRWMVCMGTWNTHIGGRRVRMGRGKAQR